jgi:galactonate dehydratase
MLTRREFCGLLSGAAAAATGKLKITGFRTHKGTLRWRDLMFLEVLTDGGITGLGEATLETRTDLAEQALRWLEQQMVGLDPAGPEEHWDRNYYRLSRWRNGPDIFTALSAVDIALWDIEGKRLGVPVWRLLGGPINPKLRAYHTHWDATLPARTAEAISEHAAHTREKGWTAIKFTVPQRGPEPERKRIAARELEAIRKAVGDSMDICLEAAEAYTVRSAIEFARAVAPYKPLFLEEPVWRENPAALGEVAAKSPVPIATGEGLFSRYEFRQLLEAKGAAIVQPDVMHAGGITEIRKIANLAETFGAEVAPHQCSGPIGHVASMTAMSVCRNFLIQEWEGADDALYLELTGGKYPVQKDGYVSLPDGSGLGIRVDFEQFKKRCPYKPITHR